MPTLLVRPATPQDEAAVVALASQIWEGHDYVGVRFRDWLADKEGRFTLVYAGSRLAACGKLTKLGPGEWWLQGLRVAPAFRSQGLARLMHNINVALAEELGSGTLRFATGAPAVRKLAMETDFRIMLRYQTTTAPALDARDASFQPVSQESEAEVRTWLEHSPALVPYNRTYEQRWTWYDLLPRLTALIQAGRVWWYRPDGMREGLLIGQREGDTFQLNYIDEGSDHAKLVALLLAARALAGAHGCEATRIRLPVFAGVDALLIAAGWTPDEDEPMSVFERSLSRSTPGT